MKQNSEGESDRERERKGGGGKIEKAGTKDKERK